VTRARVARCIVLASIGTALAIAAASSLDSPDASTRENAVAAFVDAFNERDAERLCELSSRPTRQAFESVALDPPPSLDELHRALDRWDIDNPDNVLCLIGAEAASDRLGHIGSGAVTRTIRETSRLAYAITARGRWKLARHGNTWKVARHPRLQALGDDGEAHARR
jgi:hypothetical protein